MVTIIKHEKSTIYHANFVKLFSDGTVSNVIVSTDGVLNTTNYETWFTELRIFFEEYFDIKFQEGYFLKYLNLRICQSHLGFSIDQTDHIMELVNEWFPTRKFRKVDTPFSTDSAHEKELMAALPLTVNTLHKK